MFTAYNLCGILNIIVKEVLRRFVFVCPDFFDKQSTILKEQSPFLRRPVYKRGMKVFALIYFLV